MVCFLLSHYVWFRTFIDPKHFICKVRRSTTNIPILPLQYRLNIGYYIMFWQIFRGIITFARLKELPLHSSPQRAVPWCLLVLSRRVTFVGEFS